MIKKFITVFAFLIIALSGSVNAHAKQQSNTQDLIDGIISDVIDRTADAARREVERATGIDPMRRGFDPKKKYQRAPAGTSDEARRELQQLKNEHSRKISKLENELQRKLDKARSEFEREAGKEDKADKIKDKRKKLREKVDKAYDKFEEKIAKENDRFDEKRDKILSKS